VTPRIWPEAWIAQPATRELRGWVRHRAKREQAVYCASKWAVTGWGRAIAVRSAAEPIVRVFCPGGGLLRGYRRQQTVDATLTGRLDTAR
jgi:NAD(P)-dependent dehydrogenase (short-subunit alcohol dehydrogenase family)